MNIDGSAFGQRIASPTTGGGNAGQATNSYDAQIRRLQKQREQYVEKLQNVREEASDPEQAERLAGIYQMAITGIDARISQLQQAKADDAQRKAEEQQASIEPSREVVESGEAGGVSETKEAEQPESVQRTEEGRRADDPFALQEGEELFWIDDGERSWPGKKREPKYPSVLVDMVI